MIYVDEIIYFKWGVSWFSDFEVTFLWYNLIMQSKMIMYICLWWDILWLFIYRCFHFNCYTHQYTYTHNDTHLMIHTKTQTHKDTHLQGHKHTHTQRRTCTQAYTVKKNIRIHTKTRTKIYRQWFTKTQTKTQLQALFELQMTTRQTKRVAQNFTVAIHTECVLYDADLGSNLNFK